MDQEVTATIQPIDEKAAKKASSKLYHKNYLFYGLFNLAISVMWGAYNNYFPIILQGGRADFTTGGIVATGFGLSAFATGLIMSMDNILGVAASPLFGAMGDKSLNRKKIGGILGILCALFFISIPTIAKVVTPETSGQTLQLLFPLVFVVFAAFLCVLTDNWGGNYRAGYQFTAVPKLHHSTMSSFSVTFGGIGYVASTLLASVLYNIDHAYPFYLGAALELIVCTLFLATMPAETEKNARLVKEMAATGKKRANPFKTIKEVWLLLTPKARWSFLLILVFKDLGYFGIYGLQTFASSWMLNKHGIAPNVAAITTAVYFLVYTLVAIPIGLLADKVSKFRLFIVSLLLMIAGGVLFLTIASTVPIIMGLCILLGIGACILDVITMPLMQSLLPDGVNAQGTIFSLALASIVIFTVITVPLQGFFIDLTKDYDSMFYSMIIGAVLAFIPLYFLWKLLKSDKSTVVKG